MASWYNIGLWHTVQGTHPLNAATVKALLLTDSYTFDPDHGNVSTIATGNELSVTNYTGGAGGSGRKTLTASFGAGPNNTNNRVDVGFDDVTWSSLGGTVDDTITGLVVYIHLSGSDDTQNIPLAYYEILGGGSGYLTNGSDFLADFAAQSAGGNLQLILGV